MAAAALMAGCAAVGPDYREPVAQAPAQWAATLPHDGRVDNLTDWWTQLDDPVLTRLQQAAGSDSPTLAVAWGNIEVARATLASARAGSVPTVSIGASASRARQQDVALATTRSVSSDASWEVDLFGKVRRSVESANAQLQARQGDWHDARVSLAAEVATTYVQYRGCGLLVQAYEQQLRSINETARATESLVRAGLAPTSDAALASATQASTTSSLLEQRAQCELRVTSLGNLTGLQDAELRFLLKGGGPVVPDGPGLAVQAVPAQVLKQRPDVAASERALAASSANIGVAQANLYPSLTLGGSIGLSAAAAGSFTSWSFGPSLSLPLLDGGARRAAVVSARASYEVAYAQWRDTVRNAVTEVEKALVELEKTGQRALQAERAAQEYRRYLVASQAEQRAGTISLLTFEDVRRQALSAQIESISLQRDRVVQWIALYKALGGGWDPESPVTPPRSRALSPNT